MGISKIESLRVGIVGAGFIGNKRAQSLRPEDRLVWVADTDAERAGKLANAYCATAFTHWHECLRSDVDAVIVATSNQAIVECAVAFLKAGKHVLVEKPAGRFPAEVMPLVETADLVREEGFRLCVGFNHRFHPGLQRLKKELGRGSIGDLMYVRARYGHGGRIGYDREWRADPQIAGGGELLDQGVHLIDLSRWVLGDLSLQSSQVGTYYWDMPVEDNGFLLLKSVKGPQTAQLHASCTEWKNTFEFEVFGKRGKLQVLGLGRSYGTEEFRRYLVRPEMGVPDFDGETFPGEDQSWNLEWQAFASEINGEDTDIGKPQDVLACLNLIHDAYQQNGLPFAKR